MIQVLICLIRFQTISPFFFRYHPLIYYCSQTRKRVGRTTLHLFQQTPTMEATWKSWLGCLRASWTPSLRTWMRTWMPSSRTWMPRLRQKVVKSRQYWDSKYFACLFAFEYDLTEEELGNPRTKFECPSDDRTTTNGNTNQKQPSDAMVSLYQKAEKNSWFSRLFEGLLYNWRYHRTSEASRPIRYHQWKVKLVDNLLLSDSLHVVRYETTCPAS